jgi:catechol 2,3-dioxygenase-like lactoylglutathione lyase family enzyme
MTEVVGVDHVALTVSDLDVCSRFYEELGFSAERHLDFAGEGAEWLTGVPDAALRMVFLVLDGFRLELIQFTPTGSRPTQAINDPGSGHICIRVRDIDRVYSRLTERGAVFVAPPYHDPSGVSMAYFSDPEGNQLELLEIRGRNET